MNIDSSSQGGTLATPSEDTKFFTLAEARATLPLVKRIIRDIVEQYQEAIELSATVQAEELSIEGIEDLEAKRQAISTHLNDLALELSEIGCELKDWEAGLLDYPAILDGREVYLCWRLGEETITHWHELHAGFNGRKAINEDNMFDSPA